MDPQDFISAAALPFFVGMIWLRTRIQYRGKGSLLLQPAGRFYFGSAALALVLGWIAAPWLARLLWPSAAAMPLLRLTARMSWYLATYYAFIVVHRVLKSGGKPVFARKDGMS